MLQRFDYHLARLPPPSPSATPPPQAEEELGRAFGEIILPPFTGEVSAKLTKGVLRRFIIL
jgi:hypothetical protein